MRRTNKTLRQGVCTTYIGHRHLPGLPEEWRHEVTPRSDLGSPGKISRLGEFPHSRWESSQKRRERKKTWGKAVFPGTGLFLYFPGPLLYFELYIEINGKYKVTQGQLSWALLKPRFLHSFQYTKFSGDLHHLLANRPANILWPFLMMISQSENLLKAPNKVASLQGRGPVGYNQENNLLSLRSNVINIKVNTYFSYMLVISISVYKGQGIWRLSSKYWLNNETLHQYNFSLTR